jgi:hypothetical protein
VTRWLPQQKNFGCFLLPTSSLLAFTNLPKEIRFCNPYDFFIFFWSCAADRYAFRIPDLPVCCNVFATSQRCRCGRYRCKLLQRTA